MAAIHIGISGWRYTPWREGFSPKGLTQKRELQFASRAVNSIEINGSFYALQRPERYLIAPRQKPRARKSRQMFCYFDNDIQVRAPFDARSLLQRFGLDKDLQTASGAPAAEGVPA